MKLLISKLRKSPDWHRLMAAGKVSGDGFWLIQDEKDHPTIAPGQSKARKWPLWARALRLLAKKGDAGVGDTLARLLGILGVKTAMRWIKQVTGHGCRCRTRQQDMNISWPYNAPLTGR